MFRKRSNFRRFRSPTVASNITTNKVVYCNLIYNDIISLLISLGRHIYNKIINLYRKTDTNSSYLRYDVCVTAHFMRSICAQLHWQANKSLRYKAIKWPANIITWVSFIKELVGYSTAGVRLFLLLLVIKYIQ